METKTGSRSGLAVEVIVSWKNEVMDAEIVSLDRARTISVGENGRFLLPIALRSGADSFDLLVVENGQATLRVPPMASALVTENGESKELGIDITGERTIALTAAMLAEVKQGEFTFFVRPSACEKSVGRGPLFDARPLRWIGAALAFHMVVLGTFFFAPPDASALSIDLTQDQARYVQVHMAAAELTPPPAVPTSGGNGGPSGPSSSDAGGTTPTPDVAGGPGRPHVRSHAVSAPITREQVASLSAFSQLAHAFETLGDPSPYASGSELLTEGPGGPGSALLPGGIGDGLGGPVTMHGPGHGTCRIGEQCGDGTIDQGGLDTGHDHGPHDVDLVGDPRSHVSRIRPDGNVTTVGGLSREQIRAVVARHRPEVRFCYEQALISRPDLAGRVAVAFQISPDGHVSSSGVSAASDGTERVASCVGQAVSRWTFPASASPTGVTYPFILESAQ
jgi:hypothetical protein